MKSSQKIQRSFLVVRLQSTSSIYEKPLTLGNWLKMSNEEHSSLAFLSRHQTAAATQTKRTEKRLRRIAIRFLVYSSHFLIFLPELKK